MMANDSAMPPEADAGMRADSATMDAVAAARPAAWRAVAVLTALYGFASLDRQMVPLLVTPIKTELGLNDVQISLIQGVAFSLFFVAASLPVGWLVDRASRRMVVFWGTIGWSLAAASSGLAKGFGSLFASRAGVGAGEVTIQPAAFAIIAGLFAPSRLALPLSIFVIGANLGSGLSMILGGMLMRWLSHGGGVVLVAAHGLSPWRLTFLFTGLPGLALAFLIFLIPDSRNTARHDGGRISGITDLFRHYRRHTRFYIVHNLGFAACLAFVMALLSWNPAYIGRSFGWDIGRIGLWLGTTQILSAAIGLLVHGWAVDRLYRAGVRDAHLRYFMILCPIAAMLTASAYMVHDVWLMLMLFNLGYICVIGYPGIGAAALQIATPPTLRGQASAVYLIGLNLLGAMIGPLIVAAITDYGFGDERAIGPAMALSALLLMAIATACFTLGLAPMRRAMASAEP